MEMKRGSMLEAGYRFPRERGAMLALVALALVGLMGMLVLTIDAGFAHRQRRMAQTAADAGAQAGALEIFRLHRDSAVTTAFAETARNGFTNGVNNVVVTVNNPPLSGSHVGDTLFIEVIVQQSLNTFFGNVVNKPTVSVQPRSVAGVVIPSQNCIIALAPSGDDALDVVAGAEVHTTNCNIAVNSNDPQALHVVCSEATVLDATAINVTGGYYGCGVPSRTPNPPTTGVTPSSDPLSYVSLQVSDTSGACLGGTYDKRIVVGTETLVPGNYCGGLKVSGTANLSAGLYVIKGGGFEISSGGNVNGTGVSFVDLNAPAANGGADKFDVFNFASDAVLNVSAMTSGSLSGILFYVPPDQGDLTKLEPHRIHSSAVTTMNGSIYMPTHALEMGSGGTLTINGGIVASTIQFASDSRVNVLGFSGGGGFYTLTRASIVE